jgi:flagellar motor switch protein FliG
MAARAAAAFRDEDMTGQRKSAVLCMAMGSEAAAKVLQQLTPAEVEAISLEIATSQRVDQSTTTAVLTEFYEVARAAESVAVGGIDVARTILDQAVGSQRANGILDRIREQMVDTGLRRLRKAPPELLHTVLRGEHPQTMALILAHLDRRQAVAVVETLDPTVAADVLLRMAGMEKIAPDMLQLVELGLSGKTDLSLSQEMTASGGPDAVAGILNLTSSSLEKTLLAAIATRNDKLAEEIRNFMFVFEDLRTVDDRSIQRILRDVESKDLALSFKAASEELKQHILKSMSERASAALSEEVEFLGPVKVKDVEAAQSRILAAARTLEEAGEVTLSSSGRNQDVVIS